MKKQLSTKKALIASILTLCMCFAMLVGTTFAWFTDSVTSSGNVIKTGTLKVGFYWSEAYNVDPATAKWENAKDGAIFNDDKWEPGYTVARHLKIVNEGTLALKYQLAIIPHGEVSKLADVIDVYYVDGATKIENRTELGKRIGTLAQLIETGIHSDALPQGKDYTATIVLKMQETAGNEYQNLSIGSDFSIQLLATQYTYEPDSFDDQYDVGAFKVVDSMDALGKAIETAVDTTTIFIKDGDYTLGSQITIEGKSLNIVGLGVVNIKMTASQHMFTIQDCKDPESDMVVNIKNINLDGNNVAKNGFNVKYNVTANLENVTVKNTGWADVLLDNANKYNDGKFYNGTDTVVNLKNSHVEDVSMDALPVIDTHSYANAGVDTYAHFNFDKESTVVSIEIQNINKKPENCYINGSNIHTDNTFYVYDDETLANALNIIKTNSKYWNTDDAVVISMAAGEYSEDYVINQYPNWNGVVGAGTTANNYAGGVSGKDFINVAFVGESSTNARAASAGVVFTGNVTVNGFGNAGTGFTTATASTVFQNVKFDAANSVEANGEDYITVYLMAAASNVKFVGCTFENATHVTLGGSGANGVGKVDVIDCTFNDGGCLAGYVETLNVSDTTVTAARNGFIDKKKAGPITVDNCDVVCSVYFIRTDNSGINATVTNTTVNETDVPNSKGTGLVVFRGSGHKVEFTDCTLTYETLTGGAGTGVIEIYDFYDVEGVTYVEDEITGVTTLYLVPEEYEGDTVEVAEGVDVIGDYAFAYNNNVKTVVLSSTVRALGRGFDSSKVEKVVLNEGLEVISSRAFKETTNLKEVVISSTVTTIADDAFQKTWLKTITIPANVEYVGVQAFGSSQIETVIFEGNPTIQNKAFRGCKELRTVYFNGDDVTFENTTGQSNCWFCNNESNNPNTTEITFNVKNPIVAKKVKAAMGKDIEKVTINCETEYDEESGFYIDDEGNKCVYVDSTAELISAIKDAPVGETIVIYLANGTYDGDINITLADLGKQGGDVVIKPMDNAEAIISGTVTLGYRNQGVGATMYNANVTFDGITFDHAAAQNHSLDIQDVKSLTLVNCTIIGDGEYGIVSARGNATGTSSITKCTFENAAIQGLGNFCTGLVIDGCTFNNSRINIQAGNGVTVQNCDFNSIMTAVNVGDSFYAIRSNSTPITVKNCKFNIDSELTEVATAQTKWYLLANRGSTNWTVENVAITLTDAALAQTELLLTTCTSTGKINTTNFTVNGGFYVTNADELAAAVANGETNLYLANGEYDVKNCKNKTLTISGSRNAIILVNDAGSYEHAAGGFDGSKVTFNGVTIKTREVKARAGFVRMSGIYNDCAIIGNYSLFGDSTFTGCDFDANVGEHCVWTYGAKNVSFVDCDFTYGDRCINVYIDNGKGSVNVSFDGCTFATKNTASKGAVEINSSVFPQGANVSFVDCIAPEYGTMVGISGWDGTQGATANITVNGAAFTATQWAK